MADAENQDTENNSENNNSNETPSRKGFWKSVSGIWAAGVKRKRLVDKKLYGTSPFWFFVICLLIHLYDISTGFSEASARLAMYIVLAIIAWVVVFKREGGVIDV